VLLVGAGLLPPPWAGWLSLLLALLLAGRFFFWKPHLALRRLDLGIMYLGYLASCCSCCSNSSARPRRGLGRRRVDARLRPRRDGPDHSRRC
jgi:hypothetical protein